MTPGTYSQLLAAAHTYCPNQAWKVQEYVDSLNKEITLGKTLAPSNPPEAVTEETQEPAEETTESQSPGAIYCKGTIWSGGEYYVQLFGIDAVSEGRICTSLTPLTASEFKALGLTKQCTLADDKTIAQKHGILSYYSTDDPASIEAARTFC